MNMPGKGIQGIVPTAPPPPGSSGLVVPEHIARAALEQQRYQGLLTGSVAAEEEVMCQPGREKEFMTRLEALMIEFKVHKLEMFWKGPFMPKGPTCGR